MKKNKLKIGILTEGYHLSAWTRKMIEDIMTNDYASVDLVVVGEDPNDDEEEPQQKSIADKLRDNSGQITHLLIKKLLLTSYEKLIDRQTFLPDAFESVDCEDLFSSIPTIKVKTRKTKWSDYFHEDDVKEIKDHDIDIFIRCGFGILRGDILSSAKYGIWSYHHGDNNVNRGGPAGYWESMQSWSETGSVLQILSEDLDNGQVLYRSFSNTDTMSLRDNRSNFFWKTLSFMPRKMEELYRLGEDKFFAKVEHENRHPIFYSDRLYTEPSNAELAKLTFNKLKEKVKLVFDNKFRLEQWVLMFHLKDEFSSSLWRYKKIIPPKDRFWADPHIIYKDNTYYIFLEELPYSTDKGHISLITMDEQGNYSEPELILDKPYHLSYPFIFEHENEFYMIPESAANRTVELYKCVDFPLKWEFEMNLMEDVQAVDATLLFHNNKWWMFTNMVENKGASSWDELFLFSSDDLLSQDWQPHPMNPVISDVKSSRPAGKIFIEDGRIYRPSQNCSVRYGYGFNINEITVLDDENYAETIVSKVEPNWDKDIIGTHTFNRANALHIIDAIYKRKK